LIVEDTSNVCVLIGTTDGPVSLLRLVQEKPVVRRSDVYIGSSTERAGIGRAYNSFVSSKTGLIERIFGNGAYRINVSDRIDAGSSWQLGFFLAHALKAGDRLAGGDQAGHETVVWTTGTVRSDDLSVGEIGYLAKKLTLSLERLAAEAKGGKRVLVAYPAVNATEVDTELRRSIQSTGASIIEVDSVRQLLRELGLPPITWEVAAADRVWQGTPFRNLEPFESRHREIFFGRGRAREEALERLRRAAARDLPFLLIHGRSGAGKSSLVRAGLVGDIKAQASEADVWLECIITPQRLAEAPLRSLIDALHANLPQTLSAFSPASLLEDARARSPRAVEAIRAAIAQADPGRTCKLILVIDQLEELLLWAREQTDAEAGDDREAFGDLLVALSRSGAVWTIATLRSDLLGSLDDSPALSRLANDDNIYRLERPTRMEFREIILRPVAAARLALEGTDPSGLPFADVLIDKATASPDSLPLLQFVLSRLFEFEGRTGRLTYAMYARLQGLEGAIGRLAEDNVQALVKDGISNEAIDQVILSLGRYDRDLAAITARWARVPKESSLRDRVHIIETLARARLLVLDEGSRARVAHEAVLTHWPRAKSLFETAARDLELRDLLEPDAEAWDTHSRDPAFLMPPGRRLTEAEGLVARGRVLLSSVSKEFVDASLVEVRRLAEEDRRRLLRDLARQRRRTRFALSAVGLIAILGIIAFAFGFLAEQERNSALLAQSRFLARESRIATDSGDATLGKLLAARALPKNLDKPERPFLAEAESSLEYAFGGSREIALLRGHRKMQVRIPSRMGENLYSAGSIDYAVYSTDGGRIVTSSGDGTIRIWDAKMGRQLALIETIVGRTSFISLLPDGRLLVLTDTRLPEVRDSTTGALLKRFEGGDECVTDVGSENAITLGAIKVQPGAFHASPEGGRIVTVSGTTLCLWDASGSRIRVLKGPGKEIKVAMLSRIGDRLVVVNDQGLGALVDGKNGDILLDLGKNIKVAKFSHDGSLLAIGSSDKDATIRRASDGKVLANLTGHESGIGTLDFSSDDAILATGSDDRTVRLWRTSDGRPRTVQKAGSKEAIPAVFKHRNPVQSVTFSGDGSRLLASAGERDIALWNVERGWQRSLVEEGKIVSVLQISDDGRRVITYSKEDKLLHIWADGPDPIDRLRASGDVTALAISPDGTRFISGSEEGIGQIWSTEPLHPALFQRKEHDGEVSSLAFGESGALISTGVTSIVVRNAKSGELVRAMKQSGVGAIRQALLGPNDTFLMTLTNWGTTRVWRLSDGKNLSTDGDGDLYAEEERRVSKGLEQQEELGRAPDYEVPPGASNEILRQKKERLLRALPGTVKIISSPDRRFAVPLVINFELDPHENLSVGVFDLVEGSVHFRYSGAHGSATAAAFSNDGRLFALGFLDGAVIVADTFGRQIIGEYAAGGTLASRPLRRAAVMSMVFSSDGDKLIHLMQDGTVRFMKVADGSTIKTMEHDNQLGDVGLALSPDGSRIVTTGWSNAKLWRSDGEFVANLGAWGGSSPSFSNDGSRIITRVGPSGLLWDAANGEQIAALYQPGKSEAYIHGFAKTGKYIVTTHFYDPHLRLWDDQTGQPLIALNGPAGSSALRASISPDGKFVAAGWDNGHVTVWEMPERCQLLIEKAASSTPRALSKLEFAKYFLNEEPVEGVAKWVDRLRKHIPVIFARSSCNASAPTARR